MRADPSSHEEEDGVNVEFYLRKAVAGVTTATGNIWRRGKEWRETSRSSEKFVYSPLPPGPYIRLLTIEPGDNSQVIRCSLEAVSLEDGGGCPEYTALSYTWRRDGLRQTVVKGMAKLGLDWPGTVVDKWEGMDETIVCMGRPLRISPSLYGALLEIRKSRPNPGPLWVDAVCMNQEDDAEKDGQIALMGRIYRSAHSVIVWLGTCPHLCREGVELLLSSGSPGPGGLISPKDSSTSSQDKKEGQQALAFRATLFILSRRWFRRLWVVQEVALARKVEFWVGEYRIPQELLIQFIDWAYSFKPDVEIAWELDSLHLVNRARADTLQNCVAVYFQEVVEDWGSHVKTVPALIRMKESGTWPLQQWIRVCKGRKAFDCRDFVFAGLSLIRPQDLQINPNVMLALPTNEVPYEAPRLWPRLKPTKGASVAEVLLNLAACILSNGLDILSVTSFLRSLEPLETSHPNVDPHSAELPSWLPDPSPWTPENGDIIGSLGDTGFRACTRSGLSAEEEPKISADGRVLYIDAMVIDQVKHHYKGGGSPWTKRRNGERSPIYSFLIDEPREYRHSGLSKLEALVSVARAHDPPLDRSTLREAVDGFLQMLYHDVKIWRRLRLDKGNALTRYLAATQHNAASRDPSKIGARHETWALRTGKVFESVIDAVVMPEDYKALKAAYPDHEWPTVPPATVRESGGISTGAFEHEFVGSTKATYEASSFFLTEQGYIGRGPAPLQDGDMLVLAKGATVPYILRHIDDARHRHKRTAERMIRDPSLDEQEKARWQKTLEDLEKKIDNGDERWVLVGSAYVEGVMYGEAVNDEGFSRFSLV